MEIYYKNQLKEDDLIKTRKYMVYVLSSTFLYLRQTSLINCRADKTVLSLRILCNMVTTRSYHQLNRTGTCLPWTV